MWHSFLSIICYKICMTVVKRLLLILAIVGFVIAPLAGRMTGTAAEQDTMVAMDDMPCCPPSKPAMPDCMKDCPLLAFCLAKCVSTAPLIVADIVRRELVGDMVPVHNDELRVSWAQELQPRPPRT